MSIPLILPAFFTWRFRPRTARGAKYFAASNAVMLPIPQTCQVLTDFRYGRVDVVDIRAFWVYNSSTDVQEKLSNDDLAVDAGLDINTADVPCMFSRKCL